MGVGEEFIVLVIISDVVWVVGVVLLIVFWVFFCLGWVSVKMLEWIF